MSVACAKCGAEVSEGAQFCAVCGTAVTAAGAAASNAGFTPVSIPGQSGPTPQTGAQAGGGSAPAAAGTPPLPGYTQVNAGAPSGTPYPPAAYPPAGAPPAGAYAASGALPARSGGGGAVKIILIILAIVIGLGILGAGAFGFVVWRVAHAFHVNGKHGEITLNTPGGSVSAGAATDFTSEELGADIYPGAKAEKGGMRMNLPSGSIVSGVFVTPDSKDQVVSFYKDKFGSEASVYDASDSAMISLKKGEHENVMVTISSRGSENDGKTKISIVHTKNRPS